MNSRRLIESARASGVAKGCLREGRLRSVLVSRYPDLVDEAVAASAYIDDKPIPIASVPQRAAQRGNLDREVGGLDK
jgi:hypothetical protein